MLRKIKDKDDGQYYLKVTMEKDSKFCEVDSKIIGQECVIKMFLSLFQAFKSQGIPKEFFIDILDTAYDMKKSRDYTVKDVSGNESK